MLSIFLTLIWIFGGLALDSDSTVGCGILLALIWWGIGYSKKRYVHIPSLFKYYCLLVFVEALSLFWSKDQTTTLRHLILLTSGGIWWLAAETWKKVDPKGKHILNSIYLAGISFLLLWLIQSLFQWPINFYGPSSLIAESSAYKNHNHIGDWWMLIASIISGNWSLWLFPAVAMILVSRSRSAIIGLFSSWGYWVFVNKKWRQQHRSLIIIMIIMVMSAMIFLGSKKSTLSDRDYFVQSFAGLIKYPFGVGLGNFAVISKDPETHWWGRDDYATVTHNLLLEWTTGAGILGFTGWIWLALASWRFGFPGSKSTNPWRNLYWALILNFLLDTTYFIPSMWWLFLIVIAMSEE